MSNVAQKLNKKEVIELLGKSKRTIENYIATGRLACGYINGRNGKEAAFDRAEVERLKHEFDAPAQAVLVGPVRASHAPRASAPAVIAPDPFAGLAAHLAKLSAAFPPPTVGKWLTLDEAATTSGMPRSWLLAQARGGAPWAMNAGTEKKALWRFRAEAK